MLSANKNIKIKKFCDSDINLFEHWLFKDHVKKWYSEPEEWIREVRFRDTEFSFIKHFIVYENSNPIGFCQYYDCFFAKEDWYSLPPIGNTYSIDYLIGEESCLGRGYGKIITALLINEIKEINGVKRIIVKPEIDNLASCGVLTANKFVFDNERQYYYIDLCSKLIAD